MVLILTKTNRYVKRKINKTVTKQIHFPFIKCETTAPPIIHVVQYVGKFKSANNN